MRVATFNAHDSRRAGARAFDLAQLVAWQEAPRQLELLARERGRQLVRGGKGVAVTWPATDHWALQRASWHQAHPGRRLVSPARGTLRVDLHAHGVDLTVLCAHRVNGTGLDGRRRRPAWRWRRARWFDHARLDAALLDAAVRSNRRLVLLAMDGNREGKHTPAPHPAARLMTPGRAIDQLWLVDLDGVTQKHQTDAHRIGSDHPLRRLRFDLAWSRAWKARR